MDTTTRSTLLAENALIRSIGLALEEYDAMEEYRFSREAGIAMHVRCVLGLPGDEVVELTALLKPAQDVHLMEPGNPVRITETVLVYARSKFPDLEDRLAALAGGAVALAQRFNYIVRWSDADRAYSCTVYEFPQLIRSGRTATEASDAATAAVESAVAQMLNDGETVPAPSIDFETFEEYSARQHEYFSSPEAIARMASLPPSATYYRGTGKLVHHRDSI